MPCNGVSKKRKVCTNAFPRGEGGPPERSEEVAGRMRNAGDHLVYYQMWQAFDKVGFSSSILDSKHQRCGISLGSRPHSSSVTAIGSEAPIAATASPRGKPLRYRSVLELLTQSFCFVGINCTRIQNHRSHICRLIREGYRLFSRYRTLYPAQWFYCRILRL